MRSFSERSFLWIWDFSGSLGRGGEGGSQRENHFPDFGRLVQRCRKERLVVVGASPIRRTSRSRRLWVSTMMCEPCAASCQRIRRLSVAVVLPLQWRDGVKVHVWRAVAFYHMRAVFVSASYCDFNNWRDVLSNTVCDDVRYPARRASPEASGWNRVGPRLR